jgi:hypothetical protein
MSAPLPSGRTAQLLALTVTCCALLLSFSTRGKMMLHTMGPLHRWYHLALFIFLGVLAMRGSANASIRLAFLIAAALLGLSIEYIEGFRYGNALEWYDVRTDTTGVALGCLLGWLISLRASKQSSSPPQNVSS